VTDGKEIEDFVSIAEAFDQHFATVGKNPEQKNQSTITILFLILW